MLASGNSAVEVCAENIIKTIRGEVPMVRSKGISDRIIDSPLTRESAARADVQEQLKIYEKRIRSMDISIGADDAADGDVGIRLKVSG